VGLNIPQIELLVIWVVGMHCVIVTKLWGAQIFGVGLNIPTIYRTHEQHARARTAPGMIAMMVGYEYAKELAVCVERWRRTGPNAE
jgi:hypothetical protein